MHPDQLPLDDAVARRLVHEQFPQWAADPVTPLASVATTSYIHRIGTHHTARFPMRREDAGAVRRRIETEFAAMSEFAALSTVPAPLPAGIGEPAHGYPLPWTVQTWVDGTVADPSSAASSEAFAGDLAALIGRMRAADTAGRTFAGSGRGGLLASHDDWVAHCLTQSAGMLPVGRLRAAWAALRSTPRGDAPDVMSHGDLIPGNLLLVEGRLAGVLDTGGFAPADPALDFVVAWHALDGKARGILRGLASDDAEWRRGAAWALQQALGLVWYYAETNPGMSALGRSTIARLLTAPELGL